MDRRFARSVIAVIVLGAVGGCTSTTQTTTNDPQGLLAGTGWQLQMLGASRALAAAQPTVEFARPDKVSGSGSCNRFNGSVTVAGKSITFGPLASTRMACAEAVNQQESLFFKALAQAEWFTIGGTALTIYTKAIDEPLVFVRTDPQ